jgi:hypothetical protein
VPHELLEHCTSLPVCASNELEVCQPIRFEIPAAWPPAEKSWCKGCPARVVRSKGSEVDNGPSIETGSLPIVKIIDPMPDETNVW